MPFNNGTETNPEINRNEEFVYKPEALFRLAIAGYLAVTTKVERL